MPLTTDQLKNLNFGYLRGADLVRYSPVQLLTKQYEVDPDSLSDGCQIAYSELISLLNTRYALSSEFNKRGFTNAMGVAVVAAGVVTAIGIPYGGTNYGSAPVVTISGTGTDAAATADISGAVTNVNMTAGGSGYQTAPIVSFTGGGGTGATGTAVLVNGKINGVNIISGGTGYTSAPDVVFTGGGGSGAAGASIISAVVSGVTITNGGSGYTSAPTVTISGGSASDPRVMMFVKVAAICAIRNILGSMSNIGDKMKADFDWADMTIRALRNAQQGMPSVNQSPTITYGSPAEVVNSSFLTLG